MRIGTLATSFLTLFLPSLTLMAADSSQTAADYRVLYTGRLYGYFRYPEIQKEDMKACPVTDSEGGALGEIEEELLRQFGFGDPEPKGRDGKAETIIPAGDQETTVRVSVGDNFAPFLLARLIQKDTYLKGKEDAEDVHLPMDNVGCFMQLLHLDAVVPGEHDFYFGPERLRVLARLLRQPGGELHRDGKQPLQYGAVRMLGANLSLRTRFVDPTQPYTTGDQNTPAGSEPSLSDEPVPALPPVVLPWLRNITINNGFSLTLDGRKQQANIARAKLKSAAFTRQEAERFNVQVENGVQHIGPMSDEAGHKYEFTRSFDKICITLAGKPPAHDSSSAKDGACKSPELALTPRVRPISEEYKLSIDVEYGLAEGKLLDVDKNYSLVLTGVKGGSGSQGFQVQPAYFESPITVEEKQKQQPAEVKPWVCVGRPGSQQVAVFGVVDSSMSQFIGRLNDTWRDTGKGGYDPRRETDLQVSDPAEALQQVLDYFDEASECKGARKVLLAQMREHKLPDLIARMHQPFDVVVAQTDKDLATGDRNLDEVFDSQVDDRASVQPLILVPGAHFSSAEAPYQLKVRSQRVEVSNGATASLTGVVREPQPGQFQLDRGPSFHVVPLQANGIDLSSVRDTQVNLTGTPQLDGSGAHGRIVGLIVSGLSREIPPQSRIVKVERKFENKITLAKNAFMVDPFTALDTAKLVSGDLTLRDWILKLPQQERDKLAEIPPEDAPGDVWKEYLEELSLVTMQERCHADIALLQHRDVFFAASEFGRKVNSVGLYAMVNAVLWKGDFVQCMNLNGATINSLMAQSRQLQDAENRGLSTDLSHGWSLASLGANSRQTNATQRLVNAQWLDAKKLYSVAITDYLANGDTGYPSVPAGEPGPYVSLKHLRLPPLSGCVAAKLLETSKGHDREEETLAIASCTQSSNTFDELPDRPQPPVVRKQGFVSWALGWGRTHPISAIQTNLERGAQERPYWTIDLYRVEGAYNLFMHSGTEGQVAAAFPGITVVDLSAPQSSSLVLDYFARATRESDAWQLYFTSELNYGHRAQRSKLTGTTGLGDTAYQVTQSANFWYWEAGYARRFAPGYRSPAGWKVLLPIGLRTQFEPQILQIVTPGGASGSTVVPPLTARNYFVSFRPGLRYEYSFPLPPGVAGGAQPALRTTLESFVEFGYQGGEIFAEPSEFRFADGVCFVDGLSSCVANHQIAAPGDTLSSVVSNRNRFQEGLYFNFRLDMPTPLYGGTEFTVENRGDFFVNRRHDAQVDPRSYDDLRTSLVLPIYGKLSLAPTLEFILFRNKITNASYHSYSTFLSLNYSFDWHTGLKWSKVLGYANPVPPLPSLPNR